MANSREYLYNLVTGKIKGPQAVFLRGCLFALSWIYGLFVVILAGFYRIRPVRFKAKVISVGNITLGGTGKTTLVEYLCAKLNSAGNKVAVLSRGYKRDARRPGEQGMGDEPAMLQKKLPFVRVLVDKDRVKTAQKAIKDYAVNTLVLDDGLQQWRISKDLEIVTISAQNPFGNYRILPAGFLREPILALKRADIFVLTQIGCVVDTGDLTLKLKQINPGALIVESIHQPEGFSSIEEPGKLLGLDFFKGKRAAIFSGIGNPQGFENTVCSLGVDIADSFKFNDHHNYTQADLDRIIRAAQAKNLDTIITTPKDAIKIAQLKISGCRIMVLNIKLQITKNEAEFNRRLLKLYSL